MNFIIKGDYLTINDGCIVKVVDMTEYSIIDEDGIYYSRRNGKAVKDFLDLPKSQWARFTLEDDTNL